MILDRRLAASLCLIAAVLACAAPAAAAPRRETQPAAMSPELALIRSRIAAIIERVGADGDFRAADLLMEELFNQVAAYAPLDQPEIFRQAAVARRMMSQLKDVEPLARMRILTKFIEFPELAETMAMLMQAPQDKPPEAYALLDHLLQASDGRAAEYPGLTAAVCVVHDRPVQRRVNENLAVSSDALAIFKYFVAHDRDMGFSLRELPAPLLVYVVDVTGSLDEMEWAVKRYEGDRNVGSRFFDIDYDYEHLRSGKIKKITELGFTLPNISQYGGVCADQAYFASTVGKCIGVPATYVSGRSGDMSHAWVGFLCSSKNEVWWDFDSGRYPEYQGVRGNLTDPQTGLRINDSSLALTAGLSLTSAAQRSQALAIIDAVRAIESHMKDKTPWKGQNPFPSSSAKPRPIDSRTMLELVEAALRLSPYDIRGWDVVESLAKQDLLTLEDKKKWALVVDRLCGESFPDFFYDTVTPMIETIDDPKEQDRLWELVLQRLQKRLDLSAEVRFKQGELWKEHGDINKAGRCYEDVIQRMTNAGPFVIQALNRAEKLLRDSGREKRVPDLYIDAWPRTKKPTSQSPSVFRQSNWYQIGVALEKRLREFGRTREAAKVAQEMGPFLQAK